MLDEKGRLFGKINIVDLFIILVIVAAVAFVGIKFVMPSSDNAAAGDDAEMKIFVENTYKFVADGLKAGDPVFDYTGSVNLGTVKSWTVSPYYEYGTSDTGENVTYENPVHAVVEVTISCKGTMGDFGLTIGDQLYGVGHSLVFYCGESKLYGAVSGLEVK